MADDQGGFSAYGWGQSLSDMLGGYLGETGKIREENEQKNQQQLQIEQAALQHLMTSDDPNVKAAAITSWLAPRKSGSGLAKWYGQQESHPLFQQVQQMLGPQGKPASQWWLSPEQREAQLTSGAVIGKGEGWGQAFSNLTGRWPSDEESTQALEGMVGAPQRVIQHQYGTFVVEDATTGKRVTRGGYVDVDPRSGEERARDFNNQPIVGKIVDFRHTGLGGGGQVQGKWIPGKMADGTEGYIFQDISGKIWATPPPREFMTEDTPPPPGPIIIQTGQGAVPVQTRPKGGGSPQAGAPIAGTQDTLQNEAAKRQQATAALAALEQAQKDVSARANAQVPHFQGLPTKSEKLTPFLDKEAVAAGYTSWQDLLGQLAATRKAVGAPPSGITPQQAAPSTAPAGKSPGKGKAQVEKDKLDRMLQLLKQP